MPKKITMNRSAVSKSKRRITYKDKSGATKRVLYLKHAENLAEIRERAAGKKG